MYFVSSACAAFCNTPYQESRILGLTFGFGSDKHFLAKVIPRGLMTPDERERMHVLCERIATEQDHEKFVKLVQDLNDLLDHKQQRLEDASPKQ
jgi:hypothetical protein